VRVLSHTSSVSPPAKSSEAISAKININGIDFFNFDSLIRDPS